MSFAISVALLAAVVAVTCALPGTVLVLRRQAMMSDAMAHAVLPGIAVAALWSDSPTSPWLIVGATLGGVVLVAGTEWLRGLGRFTEDSAVGLVFPAFFAVGVIIISTRVRHSPISEHSVLMGDLNIAALSHWIVGNIDLGPVDAWIVGSVGLVTGIALFIARRPLSISAFDPVFGRSIYHVSYGHQAQSPIPKSTSFTAWTTRVSNPVRSPRFRPSASITLLVTCLRYRCSV